MHFFRFLFPIGQQKLRNMETQSGIICVLQLLLHGVQGSSSLKRVRESLVRVCVTIAARWLHFHSSRPRVHLLWTQVAFSPNCRVLRSMHIDQLRAFGPDHSDHSSWSSLPCSDISITHAPPVNQPIIHSSHLQVLRLFDPIFWTPLMLPKTLFSLEISWDSQYKMHTSPPNDQPDAWPVDLQHLILMGSDVLSLISHYLLPSHLHSLKLWASRKGYFDFSLVNQISSLDHLKCLRKLDLLCSVFAKLSRSTLSLPCLDHLSIRFVDLKRHFPQGQEQHFYQTFQCFPRLRRLLIESISMSLTLHGNQLPPSLEVLDICSSSDLSPHFWDYSRPVLYLDSLPPCLRIFRQSGADVHFYTFSSVIKQFFEVTSIPSTLRVWRVQANMQGCNMHLWDIFKFPASLRCCELVIQFHAVRFHASAPWRLTRLDLSPSLFDNQRFVQLNHMSWKSFCLSGFFSALTHLKLFASFDHKLSSLPDTLLELDLSCCTKFNRPLKYNLPRHLVRLHLGNGFNQEIKGLPLSLGSLTLGHSVRTPGIFNRSLSGNQFPNLHSLSIFSVKYQENPDSLEQTLVDMTSLRELHLFIPLFWIFSKENPYSFLPSACPRLECLSLIWVSRSLINFPFPIQGWNPGLSEMRFYFYDQSSSVPPELPLDQLRKLFVPPNKLQTSFNLSQKTPRELPHLEIIVEPVEFGVIQNGRT